MVYVATDEGRGERARPAGADVATIWPWGSSPPLTTARTAVGDVAGRRLSGRGEATTRRPRGDAAHVNKAARTTVGCTVADEAVAARGDEGARFGCGRGTPAAVIASAEIFARTAVEDVVA